MYASLEPLLYVESQQGFIPTSFWESMAWKREDTGKEYFEDRRIKIIEENFKKFCKIALAKDYSKPPINSSIPPIIHFIWLGSPLPANVNEAIGSWKKFHPEWEFRIWTDLELVDFRWSKPRFKSAFEEAKNCSEKSDILRYEVLRQFGGIYSDTDVICFKSFHDLIANGVTFFAGLESNFVNKAHPDPLFIGSATMGAVKGSSVIQHCLDHYRTEQEAPMIDQVMRAGPGLVSQACHEALNSPEQESILILPCSYFYPLPVENKWIFTEDIVNFIGPESLTVHLWDTSWVDHDNSEFGNLELFPFKNFSRFKPTNASLLKLLIEKHSIHTIVEAGSYFGLSTRYMAKLLPPGGNLYAVDYWLKSVELSKSCQQLQLAVTHNDFANAVDHWLKSTERLSNSYQQFLLNVKREGLTDVIIPLRIKSIDGPKHLSTTQVDLVYINAQDEDSVYNHLTAYYPLIQGHGILCGDNFNPDKWPGVVAGVKRFVLERNLNCIVHECFWCINEAANSKNSTSPRS